MSVGPSGVDGANVIEPEELVTRSPDEQALARELDTRLAEVLAKLSPKLREVFVLCAVQGLSYEDAAEVIDCPVKTVSSRLSRARDRVHEEFKRFLGDDGSLRATSP